MLKIECVKIWPNESLINFEKEFVYTFNGGFFSISHEPCYKEFFESLRFNIEEPRLFIATKNDQIVAVAIAVLQEIPPKKSKTWYICDLKIKKGNAEILVPFLSFLKDHCFSIASKVYAVSMNPKEGTNRFAYFCMRNKILKFKKETDLFLYDVSDFQMALSKKKLVINKDKQVDIYHCIKREEDTGRSSITLFSSLNELPLSLWGTASIMHNGLDNLSWDWISSCDI